MSEGSDRSAVILTLDALSLRPSGPTLTLHLEPGHSMAVFGPAGSGKSHLLRVIRGLTRPPRGSVRAAKGAIADPIASGRRQTPLDLLKKLPGSPGATRIAEVLSGLNLWECRQTPIPELSPGQVAACDLATTLCMSSRLMVIDCKLDLLGPWTLPSALKMIGDRLREGAALVLATNLPEFARRVDSIVVLNDREIAFAGTYAELERAHGQSEISVETQHQPGVRALVAPFEVTFEKTADGVRLQAKEGQKLAAKLLTEGYGDIKSVVLRSPEPAELLRAILERS